MHNRSAAAAALHTHILCAGGWQCFLPFNHMVAPPLYHCVPLNNLQAKVTEVIAAVRAAVGPDFTLMVDVQYAFDDPRAVADMVKEWDRLQLDIFFLETPLRMDQIKEMAELHTMLCEDSADGKTPRVRVAYGEWQVRARAVWCSASHYPQPPPLPPPSPSQLPHRHRHHHHHHDARVRTHPTGHSIRDDRADGCWADRRGTA